MSSAVYLIYRVVCCEVLDACPMALLRIKFVVLVTHEILSLVIVFLHRCHIRLSLVMVVGSLTLFSFISFLL